MFSEKETMQDELVVPRFGPSCTLGSQKGAVLLVGSEFLDQWALLWSDLDVSKRSQCAQSFSNA